MGVNFNGELQSRAAHVIHSASFSNTNRTSVSGTSGTADQDLWTWTYNKQVSNSYLCAMGYAIGFMAYAGALRTSFRLGSNYHMGGWVYDYHGSNYFQACPIHIPLNNYSGSQTTGNITMGIAYNVNPSNNGNRPFSILNPDNNDDNRLAGGTRSWVTVMEVLI
tara:strand:+ start:56 stop:547 length:492 start_codon:yes stop_codon:yes gene_type:complete